MDISPQTNLGELVTEYPFLAKYLLEEWGLHCVNCFANQFDTLEAGMRLHGYDDAAVGEAVEKLNHLIAS